MSRAGRKLKGTAALLAALLLLCLISPLIVQPAAAVETKEFVEYSQYGAFVGSSVDEKTDTSNTVDTGMPVFVEDIYVIAATGYYNALCAFREYLETYDEGALENLQYTLLSSVDLKSGTASVYYLFIGCTWTNNPDSAVKFLNTDEFETSVRININTNIGTKGKTIHVYYTKEFFNEYTSPLTGIGSTNENKDGEKLRSQFVSQGRSRNYGDETSDFVCFSQDLSKSAGGDYSYIWSEQSYIDYSFICNLDIKFDNAYALIVNWNNAFFWNSTLEYTSNVDRNITLTNCIISKSSIITEKWMYVKSGILKLFGSTIKVNGSGRLIVEGEYVLDNSSIDLPFLDTLISLLIPGAIVEAHKSSLELSSQTAILEINGRIKLYDSSSFKSMAPVTIGSRGELYISADYTQDNLIYNYGYLQIDGNLTNKRDIVNYKNGNMLVTKSLTQNANISIYPDASLRVGDNYIHADGQLLNNGTVAVARGTYERSGGSLYNNGYMLGGDRSTEVSW